MSLRALCLALGHFTTHALELLSLEANTKLPEHAEAEPTSNMLAQELRSHQYYTTISKLGRSPCRQVPAREHALPHDEFFESRGKQKAQAVAQASMSALIDGTVVRGKNANFQPIVISSSRFGR